MATLNGRNPLSVNHKTTNTTLSAADVGKVFTNNGASGTITFTLPASVVGHYFRFDVLAAQQLRIDPDGTETIGLPSTGAQQASGKYIVADAIGESIEVYCVKVGSWHVRGVGTWTVEP
jgi:hypothetical protein